jgi:hypothetical protein
MSRSHLGCLRSVLRWLILALGGARVAMLCLPPWEPLFTAYLMSVVALIWWEGWVTVSAPPLSEALALFPFLTFHHALRDADGCVWIVREEFRNGWYAKYTLSGMAASRTHAGMVRLFAEFRCGRATDPISVYLEDILVSKPNRHLGTWMMNRLISVLRAASAGLPIARISGTYSAVDEQDEERRARRDQFFARFGFTQEHSPHGIVTVTAVREAWRLVPMSDLVELDVGMALREWALAQSV